MNWREIFKRVGFILGLPAIVVILSRVFGVFASSGSGTPNNLDEGSWYLPYFLMSVILLLNLVEMERHVTHWGRHAIYVTALCWLPGLVLTLLLKEPVGGYITFCFWVTLIGLGGAFLLKIFENIMIQRGDVSKIELAGLSPEQVVATLGRPKKIISLESKVIYVYKDMKIIFTDDRATDVQ